MTTRPVSATPPDVSPGRSGRAHDTLGRRSAARRPTARSGAASERSFSWRFLAETGTTPHRWITQQRALRARQLLEQTEPSIDEVARSCGFGTPAMQRHHFRKATGVTPGDYRRTFHENAPQRAGHSTAPGS
ncbi:MAG: helix-turn-helix domain-containing protein [Pseudonocardiaceae bacterium]|nr:MAG: helix-turn-helix domain-containing protein [Pseudonocardiaceae bacterium]